MWMEASELFFPRLFAFEVWSINIEDSDFFLETYIYVLAGEGSAF